MTSRKWRTAIDPFLLRTNHHDHRDRLEVFRCIPFIPSLNITSTRSTITMSHNNNKQATIKPELSKKILSHSGCDKRIPNETAEAVSEVLRMFVIEARARATIEAECDEEGALMDEENNEHAASNLVSIRADHITKVAAEMLMDFS